MRGQKNLFRRRSRVKGQLSGKGARGALSAMEHIDHPSEELWEERQLWLETLDEETRGGGNYLVSEQACALIAEVQSIFCAGAWIAVVMLVLSVIDAQLRETEVPGFKGNTKKLLEAANADSEIDWLRRRRNGLVHVNPCNPAMTVDNQWFDRADLEADARKAVRLMFKTFYISPWT